MHLASGELPGSFLRDSRGWPDAAWDAGVARLAPAAWSRSGPAAGTTDHLALTDEGRPCARGSRTAPTGWPSSPTRPSVKRPVRSSVPWPAPSAGRWSTPPARSLSPDRRATRSPRSTPSWAGDQRRPRPTPRRAGSPPGSRGVSTSHWRLRRWMSWWPSNRSRTTTRGTRLARRVASALHRQPDAVDGAEAGVGHQHHRIGGQGDHQVGQASPSDAWGDRTPPAVSTTPTCTRSGGQSSSSTRSPREAGQAQRLGGHRRGHGPVVGTERVADRCRVLARGRPQHLGVGGAPEPVPSESMSNDWAGLRAATDNPRPRSSRSSRLADPGLAHLGAGAAHQHHALRTQGGSGRPRTPRAPGRRRDGRQEGRRRAHPAESCRRRPIRSNRQPPPTGSVAGTESGSRRIIPGRIAAWTGSAWSTPCSPATTWAPRRSTS